MLVLLGVVSSIVTFNYIQTERDIEASVILMMRQEAEIENLSSLEVLASLVSTGAVKVGKNGFEQTASSQFWKITGQAFSMNHCQPQLNSRAEMTKYKKEPCSSSKPTNVVLSAFDAVTGIATVVSSTTIKRGKHIKHVETLAEIGSPPPPPPPPPSGPPPGPCYYLPLTSLGTMSSLGLTGLLPSGFCGPTRNSIPGPAAIAGAWSGNHYIYTAVVHPQPGKGCGGSSGEPGIYQITIHNAISPICTLSIAVLQQMRFRGCVDYRSKVTLKPGVTKMALLIEEGDEIWNPIKQQQQKVLRVTQGREFKRMYRVMTNENVVQVTNEHPFVLENEKIKTAENLRIGEKILSGQGKSQEIIDIHLLNKDENSYVINLVLEGNGDPRDHVFEADGVPVGDLFLQEYASPQHDKPDDKKVADVTPKKSKSK